MRGRLIEVTSRESATAVLLLSRLRLWAVTAVAIARRARSQRRQKVPSEYFVAA